MGEEKIMEFKFDSLIDKEGRGFLDSFEKIIPEGLGASGEDMLLGESVGFPSLLDEVFSGLTGSGGELSAFFVFIIGVVSVMAAASLISGKLSRPSQLGVMLISGVGIFTRIYPLVAKISETLGGVLNFFTSFIPIMTGILAYGGGTAAASVGAAGANMTLGIMGAFLIPLMNSAASLVFATSLLGALSDGGGAALAKRIKSFFMWLVGIASVLLLSSLALQSAIASSADTALLRGAKYAASGVIPIVGGSVSSALGTLVTGVSYIKSAVGVGAVSVLLLLTVSPLALLLAYRFIISVGEGVLEFLDVPFGVKILGSFKAALDVLSAVFAMSVSVLILETALLMKSGVCAL